MMMTPKAKILIISLLLILLVNPLRLPGDTLRRLSLTHVWVMGIEENQAPFMVGRPRSHFDYEDLIENKGKFYRGIDELGQSLLMVPGDWVGEQISAILKRESSFIRSIAVIFLIFIPINVAAIASIFWLLKLFNFSETQAGLASLIMLLCTTFLHYAQYHQQNNQVLLFATLGYGCALASIKSEKIFWAILSGLSMGMVLLTRSTGIVHILTVFLFLVISSIYQFRSFPRVSRLALSWVAGLTPIFLLWGLFNSIRYGGFLTIGTNLVLRQTVAAHPTIYPPNYPWINASDVGIWGVLFSPAKSIFIYDPLLLPSLIFIIIFWRKLSIYIRIYLITSILNLLLHIALTSRLDFWAGDGAWGARYHVTSVHLLLIPVVGLWVQQMLSTTIWRRRIIEILLAFALFIQINSVTFIPPLETNKIFLLPPSYFLKFRLGERVWNNICTVHSFLGTFPKSCSKKVNVHNPSFPIYFQLYAFRFDKKITFNLFLLSWFVLLITSTIALSKFYSQVLSSRDFPNS